MGIGIYLLATLCVLGIATGQVLFKYSALAINQAGSIFSMQPLLLLTGTMALYGVTSIGWVLILRNAELGKIYPIMALAFVFDCQPLLQQFLVIDPTMRFLLLCYDVLILCLLLIHQAQYYAPSLKSH